MFISLEGIDGCGKSTQVRLLKQHLEQQGRGVIVTREPGGSRGAEEIRRLLVEGSTDRWSVETELLLFTAARRDHLERLIWPALKMNETVITDRFADSTRVYQGVARRDLRALTDSLHNLMIGFEPDITIILDMRPELALARTRGREGSEDRFEEFGLPFQIELRSGFLELAMEFPDRISVVDANGTPEEVSQRVEAAIISRLNLSR